MEKVLLLDVDGVLNPYPDCPHGFDEHELFPEDDEPVRLASAHGEWLRQLAERFLLVWASSWGEEANRLLCPHFGLRELPVVPLPPAPFDPAAKVPAVDAFLGSRPAAWLDDIVTPEASLWASMRSQPTLLVEVEPSEGLTRPIVDRLVVWATAAR
jgi:hypothetical protein